MQEDDDYCLASEAIAYLSAHGVNDPRRKIMDALTLGHLRAAGYFTHRIDGSLASEWSRYVEEIPVQFWEARAEIASSFLEPEASEEDDWTDNWPNSFFSNTRVVVDAFDNPTKYFQSAENVRFQYASLELLLAPSGRSNGAQSSAEHEVAIRLLDVNSGGKPASKHGDVIAAAVLRLASLPPSEFSRYTTDSLAVELANAYSKLGEAAPSERNCQKYAAGILRVLRLRET